MLPCPAGKSTFFQMAVSSPYQNSSAFLPHLLDFCRKLHEEGIKVTLQQEIDAYRSLQYIDIFRYNDFYHSLKTNLISNHEDISRFDQIFYLHWDVLRKKRIEERKMMGGGKTSEELSNEKSLFRKGKKPQQVTYVDWPKDDSTKEPEPLKTAVYSPAEKLREKDFSAFNDEDLEKVKKAIALIAKKIRLRESRRKKAVNKARFLILEGPSEKISAMEEIFLS